MSAPQIDEPRLSIPELMRIARGTYKRAIDERLAADGFEDLPSPGGYILAYLAGGEESVADRVLGLGITAAEFNQLADSMVLRGYLTRVFDPGAGSATLALTERGRAAQQASAAAARQVDVELEARLTAAELAGLCRGLAVLGEIKQSLPGPSIRRGLARR